MSVKSQTVFETGSRPVASLVWVPPRRLASSLAALGPIATAFLKVHQFLEALKAAPPDRPGGGCPQMQPEDHPEDGSIWNDPAFWMMLIH